MKKAKKISFSNDVIKEMIINILSTTPGVASDFNKNVEISIINTNIDVKYAPDPSLTNVYDLSCKIQDSIYHKIMSELDLAKLIVNVTAIKI